jgi:biopolymer transport protein ExbD
MLEAATLQPQPEVHIRSHAKAPYDAAAFVLASAQRAGLNQLGIVGSERFAH